MKVDGRAGKRKSVLTDSAPQQAARGSGAVMRAGTQEDPEIGGGDQASRVPAEVAGGRSSGDDHQVVVSPLDDKTPLSHYKGISLANVGRDAKGRVIPYKRNARTAQQVALWIASGHDVNAVCIQLNMRPGLLKELYGNEIAAGLDKISMDFTSHVYKRAKAGSDRMAIFFGKAKLGWRDGDAAQTDVNVLNIHIHE